MTVQLGLNIMNWKVLVLQLAHCKLQPATYYNTWTACLVTSPANHFTIYLLHVLLHVAVPSATILCEGV